MSTPVPGPRPVPTAPAGEAQPASLDAEQLLAPLHELDALAPADVPGRFAHVLDSLTQALEDGA